MASDKSLQLDDGVDVTSVAEMRRDPRKNPWLAAEDILDGRPCVVIESVKRHQWLGQPVIGVHFVGKSKPLLLNATNRYTLSVRLGFGRDVRKWIGRAIVLEAEKLPRSFAGREMGIRIRWDEQAHAQMRDAMKGS